MKRLSWMFVLSIMFAALSYGAGAYYNLTTNGEQSCHMGPCQTPWGTTTASCYAPNVGPGGWRIIGGSIRQYADCSYGDGYASIDSLLPNSFDLDWYATVFNAQASLAYIFRASSSCDTTTDGTGNYAGDYGDYYESYGC